MTDLLALGATWLNAAANALGSALAQPAAALPIWLTISVAAIVAGVGLLAIFKFTSNQTAIKETRAALDANMLALRLFKDSPLVALRAQGRVFAGAARLLVYAVIPMAVMFIPVTLFLGQLALFYQARPLRVGEESVITIAIGNSATDPANTVRLKPDAGMEVVTGPVRIRSAREVCWKVRAREPGLHALTFQIGEQSINKQLAVGNGVMLVSPKRPGWDWSDILLNPAEPPFRPTDSVKSIAIAYPERDSLLFGSRTWAIYWFVVSMVAALFFKRALRVNI
jgi:hypothetical protein